MGRQLPPPGAVTDPPRILIVNDDGIHATGLGVLEAAARTLTDDVWVVAPHTENSAVGHSVSVSTPVRVREVGHQRFAIVGTPSDCVLVAIWELMADRLPTIVLSGVNHGENLAEDLTYSGTMGAALEAALLGIPAVALSQLRQPGSLPNFSVAESWTPRLIEKLLGWTWSPGIVVNVNFPLAEHASGNLEITSLGQREPGTFTPMAGRDGRNVPFFWVKLSYDPGTPAAGTDLEAVHRGSVVLTAITTDMTSPQGNERLATLFPASADLEVP